MTNFANAGIVDSSMQTDLITYGNAHIDTSTVKYGSGSMYFDGTSYMTADSSSNTAFGTGDFTIEMWANFAATSWSYLLDARTTGDWALGFYLDSTNAGLQWWVGTSTVAGSAVLTGPTISTGAWHHIAIVRHSGTLTMYVDGTAVTSATDSTNYISYNPLTIGARYASNTSISYLNGYIDDLRITNGYARYTASFTPPTQLPTY